MCNREEKGWSSINTPWLKCCVCSRKTALKVHAFICRLRPHLALQVELRARIICHSLERTCCIVLAFLSSPLYFVSTFLSVSARSPWLPKSRRVWSKVHFCEKTDWDGDLKKSLPQEFFGNRRNYKRTEERDHRFSLLRGKRTFLYQPTITTDRDATRLERSYTAM